MSEEIASALDALFEPFNSDANPGFVVGIRHRGAVFYRRGFGLASVQHAVANRPSTRMRIASASKQFTCLAALLLAEDGLLDLDAPADRYLPALPDLGGVPTLRQFMNHTSGYRCTLELGTMANGWARQPPAWQVDALMRQRDALAPPGRGQMYANGTFRALSLVVEQAAGMPFAAFLATRIFEPLSMFDTEHVSSDDAMIPGMAAGHVAGPHGWERGPVDTDSLGEGGLVSTVDDLLRWMSHLRGPKRVGSEETWRQLRTTATLANGFESNYALGLRDVRYRGVRTVGHTGGVTGFNCQMLSVPQHDLDVVVLANGPTASAAALVREIIDLVLHDSLEAPPRPVPLAAYRHLVGSRYRGTPGLFVEFVDEADALALRLQNMARTVPLHELDGTIRVGFETVGLGPFVWQAQRLAANDASGAPASIEVTIAGTAQRLERIDTDDVLPLSTQTSFWSEDLLAEARLLDDDGPTLLLRGDYSGWRRFRLKSWSRTIFAAEDEQSPSDRYVIEFDGAADAPDGFWMDALRARRVRFDRVSHDFPPAVVQRTGP